MEVLIPCSERKHLLFQTGLALSLDLEETFFEEKLLDPCAQMLLLKYPPTFDDKFQGESKCAPTRSSTEADEGDEFVATGWYGCAMLVPAVTT